MAKEELSKGAVVREPGSAVKNQTGTWRTFRPVVDDSKCLKCGQCELYCPDRTIRLVGEGDKRRIVVDYAHCKGCMICAEMCPRNAIRKEREK
jgi:2-oxoacid:acceptor oxidoreductase delta subunit (pyruvate/2-ketoisovalerate family)